MKNKGFTLIELMVVIAIMGMLAVIAIPSFVGSRQRNQFLEAREILFSAIADARANAFAGKACYVSASSNQQSDTWALRLDKTAGVFSLQLMCKPTGDVSGLSCTGQVGDYCPQPTDGFIDANYSKIINAGDAISDLLLVGVNDAAVASSNDEGVNLWVQYADEGREVVIAIFDIAGSVDTYYREGFLQMGNSTLSLEENICFEVIQGFPYKGDTCVEPPYTPL